MNNQVYIDHELLKNNCAGDKSMMRELVNMGMQSVSKSIVDTRNYLGSDDWDNVARVFHKLRPVLCYCGINNLTDKLQSLENSAREKTDLPGLALQVVALLDTLQSVHDELRAQLASLSE